ncbi:unnamed protein product [Mytilus coruscus]|uniref:Reverse transcriptase zinc-binding domain-containing protein n=1 Tax=Mytilus coruscus TaxID=42192 RepID=A0A6J8AK42_MYTCO|nr:unnamed protein product [Mytilus coruscus]
MKGIRFINDIVDDKGEFLSHDAINKKYNLNVTFVDILSIKLAIPRDWKDLILQQHMSPNSNSFGFVFEYENKKMPISKLFAKDVYSLFIDRGSVSPISQQRWEESFNIEISDEKWNSIYLLAFKCTIESKLQAFQYKMLHRIVSHNYLLEKYKLSLTNECASCKEIETIEHKFFECTEIKQFWREFSNWWYLVFGVKIFLNKDSVIFGVLNSDNLVLNYCILQAKYYINYVKNTQLDRLLISVQAFLKFF